MGPRVSADWKRLLLRPFPTSTTYRNLQRSGEGVLHVTDDVLLLARAALGQAPVPPHRGAQRVSGFVLEEACRLYEFQVRSIDDTGERVQIEAEVVHSESLREFWGFNRGKHAVLEAAILATRLHLLPIAEVEAEFQKLRTTVDKTGGAQEFEAFAFLQSHLDRHRPGGMHDAR
jgi:hypothetical protein